jgi:Universal stress protein family
VSSSPIVLWQCPPKTVLVAVDFGDASARALAIAGVVASAFDARLRALHAERFEPPPYFTIEQIARLEDDVAWDRRPPLTT